MDLVTAVASLSCKAVAIANELPELHSCYKNAIPTTNALFHEVEVLRAILSRVQRVLERDCGAKGLELSDELCDVFDVTITSCTVVLACLDEELKKLWEGAKGVGGGDGGLEWIGEAKCLWREDTMMDLLQKLREQHGAVSLLFQSLQMCVAAILRLP